MRSIVLVTPYADGWFFDQIITASALHLHEAGFAMGLRVIPPGTPGTTELVLAEIERPDIDGALIVCFDLGSAHRERLQRITKPLAGVGGVIPDLPTIMINDIRVAHLATEYLIAAGHRDIAHLGGRLPRQMDFTVNSRRLKGYVDAMQAAGLEERSRFEPSDFSLDDGLRAALQLLTDPANRPTAIFAIADQIALSVYIAAMRLGLRIPEDVSLVSVDDDISAEALGLTTVRQDAEAQGIAMVDLLLAQVNGASRASLTEPHVHPVELIVRSSVGAPRPAAEPELATVAGTRRWGRRR